ncbi:MAG: hypothetical protein EBS29_09535 [Chloroflexia bacterium]|nr:hypothetical protein [Chloroflexia bacterium]
MNVVGGFVALAAAIVFAAISISVIVGIQHTLRTRVIPRFRIMQTAQPTRWASLLYVIVVAALPTSLGLLTAWQLIKMMLRVWS